MPLIHNKKSLLENRRTLRNNPTGAEKVLWRYLKGSQQANHKFRRQHSVGNYILDFYCPEELLAVELDGANHFTEEGKGNDKERDEFLASLNIKVLRFENKQIFENIKEVLGEIKRSFKNK